MQRDKKYVQLQKLSLTFKLNGTYAKSNASTVTVPVPLVPYKFKQNIYLKPAYSLPKSLEN